MDIAALGRAVGAELLGIGAEDEGAVGLLGLVIVVIKDAQRRGDSLTQDNALYYYNGEYDKVKVMRNNVRG